MARNRPPDRQPRHHQVRTPIVVNTTPGSRPAAPPKRYGKPVIVLEDARRQTFVFEGGSWVPYARTIAECRAELCQVKQLAQKVNNMTRYEVSDLI